MESEFDMVIAMNNIDAERAEEAARERLTREQVEAYRSENRIRMVPPMPAWAEEENRVMNALCDSYLRAEANLAAAVSQERERLRNTLDDFRDTILHGRGALAENGMTNDQVNDVLAEFDAALAPSAEPGVMVPSGIYGASRVKHADMWIALRGVGYKLNQSWIDEAGEDETADFSELWERITAEVKRSQALILYVEPDDFPLKGALIECGIAMASNVPIIVCAPGVEVEGRTMRPLGSWILSERVRRIDVITDALAAAGVKE